MMMQSGHAHPGVDAIETASSQVEVKGSGIPRFTPSWWAAKREEIAVAIVAVITSAAAQTHSDLKSDTDRLVGACHLENIQGADGKPVSKRPVGMLIYTADGHMSAQLMYSEAANGMSNRYVQNGHEASFGSYAVDETEHTVTHHVEGSITRDLLAGKDLPRVYSFTPDGHLIIRSAKAEEHWAVTWERLILPCDR